MIKALIRPVLFYSVDIKKPKELNSYVWELRGAGLPMDDASVIQSHIALHRNAFISKL